MTRKRDIAKTLAQEKGLSVTMALRVAGLSKSSFYHTTTDSNRPDKRRKPLDDALVARLHAIDGYEQTYGYRKTTEYLGDYNHKKVYRHMKLLNLLQPRKLKKRAKRRLAINCAAHSNTRWEADLTYVFDGQRMNYLFAIVDSHDKEIIGDSYSLRCKADQAIESLEHAVKKRFGQLQWDGLPRVTLRVDQGSQYIAKKFRERAAQWGVELQYCGIKCPNDKPYIESFFSRYKCEEVYRNDYASYLDAFCAWQAYKHWYNNDRIHQGLGFMSIPDFKKRKQSLLIDA